MASLSGLKMPPLKYQVGPSGELHGPQKLHTVRYTEMAPDRFKNFWKD